LFVQAAEPAEQMGIAAQLRELEDLREMRLKIGEKDGRPLDSIGGALCLSRPG
jgi:hypothetical protein